MNKAEFLAALSAKLQTLSEEERQRLLDYYSEMIDDRMEDGLSEESAVGALGDPDELAREILPTVLRAREKDGPVSIVIQDSKQTEREPVQVVIGDSIQVERGGPSNRVTMDKPIRSVMIDGKELDFAVQTGPLPDGATAMLECSAKELPLLDTAIEDGVLTIRRNHEHNPHSFMSVMIRIMPRPCTVTLRDRHLEQLHLVTDSGNQSLEGMEIQGALTMTTKAGDLKLHGVRAQNGDIKTLSGDIHMEAVQWENNCDAQSTSGDITLQKASAQGVFKIQTRSGDVELDTVHAGKLDLQTLNGDIATAAVSAQTAEFKASSGDLELSDIQAKSTLFAQANNGDLEARQIKAGSAALSTTSGDVAIWESTVQMMLTLQSVSGDITAKQLQANKVSVQSTSGDVRLSGASGIGSESSSLKIGSRSGDIDLDGILFDHLELSSTSGDIQGRLEGRDQDYDFRASSRAGDVHVPVSRGPRIVEAYTVSGDISIKAR